MKDKDKDGLLISNHESREDIYLIIYLTEFYLHHSNKSYGVKNNQTIQLIVIRQ